MQPWQAVWQASWLLPPVDGILVGGAG